MATSISIDWQKWETRIQEWLNQSDNELELQDTTRSDRRILTVLTVKYHLSYIDIGKLERGQCPKAAYTETDLPQEIPKQKEELVSTIQLSKTSSIKDNEESRDGMRTLCKLFLDFTGREIRPNEISTDTSAEWQEFSQLVDWHGLTFFKKFSACLQQVINQYIVDTPAYQQLMRKSRLISPVKKIHNQVFSPKNDNQIFLSIDMKSANFALLKHIGAIDAQTYPTWSDFLSIFVGTRPVFLQSKKLRMRCLGHLPEYCKLEALWTHFTGTIYQDTVYPYIEERNIDATCVALVGDEIVFQLKLNNDQAVIDLVDGLQKCLSTIPVVTFTVQTYRLQIFHWKNQHTCFARIFIGQSQPSFDLKCVPDKERNYDQAYADYQRVLNL